MRTQSTVLIKAKKLEKKEHHDEPCVEDKSSGIPKAHDGPEQVV